MEYSGYIARKLAEAAEAFDRELTSYSHSDDFWRLKNQVRKFASDMRAGSMKGGEVQDETGR